MIKPARLHLPEEIRIPAAWIGSEIDKISGQWSWTLSTPEIDELKSAAEHYLARHRPLIELTSADFPLLKIAAKLTTLRQTLIHGVGFELIRGLPVEDMSKEITSVIFCGIGAHLGNGRAQNAKGDILGHVQDFGADANDPNTRFYQTNERQTFHTDSCDIVGLLCLNEAKAGGESMLVSAVTIFNEFQKQRPDLLPLLFDRIATDRRGEIPEGAKPFFRIPVFSFHEGFLTVMYQRQYIESAQRFAEAPRLTEKHIEALDHFDRLANDPDLQIKMRLRRGDMQFVYNHSLLHDRTNFTDWPDEEKKRHLLRLWLSIPGDRPLPDYFAERFGSVEAGNRGGVM